MVCASMRRVLCRHAWMDVCLQSVYEASERIMQCSVVYMCLLNLAGCPQCVMDVKLLSTHAHYLQPNKMLQTVAGRQPIGKHVCFELAIVWLQYTCAPSVRSLELHHYAGATCHSVIHISIAVSCGSYEPLYRIQNRSACNFGTWSVHELSSSDAGRGAPVTASVTRMTCIRRFH